MKIIITGATGSLGASLVRHFSKAGHEVIACGRTATPPKRLYEFAEYFQADITRPFEFPAADVIVHSAALASDSANATELYEANVLGTLNVCDASRHITKFIHVSSSSVYPILPKPLTEDLSSEGNEKNLSPYGLTKLLAEGVINEYCKSPHRFILRPRGIYGPGDRVLLPRMLEMLRNGKMISPGKMNVRTSMTHFGNFAHAVECSIASDRSGTNTYNVSDAKTEILFDSIKKILDAIYKRNIPVKYIPLPLIKTLAAFGSQGLTPLFVRTISSDVVLDISKITLELGYNPPRKFEEALQDVALWTEQAGGVNAIRKGGVDLPWK